MYNGAGVVPYNTDIYISYSNNLYKYDTLKNIYTKLKDIPKLFNLSMSDSFRIDDNIYLLNLGDNTYSCGYNYIYNITHNRFIFLNGTEYLGNKVLCPNSTYSFRINSSGDSFKLSGIRAPVVDKYEYNNVNLIDDFNNIAEMYPIIEEDDIFIETDNQRNIMLSDKLKIQFSDVKLSTGEELITPYLIYYGNGQEWVEI